MAIGYLKVQVRTADEAVPLAHARVRVLDDEGNMLYEIAADESGDTQAIPLETLDRIFSQNPGYMGTPYADYGVTVEADGFAPVSVTEIPVFDGETAVLPVTLVPLPGEQPTRTGSGGGEESAPEQIVIGPPAVAMAGAKDRQSEAPDPRVIRHVAIPDPITVHLGVPGAAAANVQVPFLDYVKNVASSEIYPTWPEAALKANIYAIMTFALNRVYTEWYRSRGYEFDITNSTAYDQYYVPGRPIYDSISRAVDELYGEYVRRQGQEAPYFTSFCNGTTATCGGLSQWGTVSLAERGYSPERILRHYYPDDIEIAETDIVTNGIYSYPGTALRKGSSGLDVEVLQKQLARVRKNYPAIPAITDPAGTFGESTRAAVTEFQWIFNLTPDGIVGKATWYKLSGIYTAVAKLADLDSEGNSLGIGTVPPGTVLRQGSRGQDVVTLQYLLDAVSEYYPGVPAPVQDGIFGSGTRRSVVAFQRERGLVPDGIVGPATWRALYDAYRGIEDTTPPSAGGNVIEYTVRPGDTLWELSLRYDTTVEAIRKANGLTGNTIWIGQVLRIPVG